MAIFNHTIAGPHNNLTIENGFLCMYDLGYHVNLTMLLVKIRILGAQIWVVIHFPYTPYLTTCDDLARKYG